MDEDFHHGCQWGLVIGEHEPQDETVIKGNMTFSIQINTIRYSLKLIPSIDSRFHHVKALTQWAHAILDIRIAWRHLILVQMITGEIV